ncbi:MAG: MarR family transcriptional regulator [Ilumatobacteraceae bacterium]
MGRKIPEPANERRAEVAAEVADLLHAVTHRLRREARDALGPARVTWAQLRALRTLDRLGVPTRMSILADELQVAPRSATSLVDELEVRALVRRGHDPADRRAVTVEVTPSGRTLLAELGERRRRTAVGLLDTLSPEELRVLRDLLGRIAR